VDWLVVERSCEAPERFCVLPLAPGAEEGALAPPEDGDELVCAKAGAASRVVAKR